MFKLFFGKKKVRLNKIKTAKVRKTNSFKKVATRSKRYNRVKSYYPSTQKNLIYPSIIIFLGFIILSLTIFLFTQQIQPFLNNERLKFLCTYQIGDKNSKSYKEAKIKLDKIVGEGDKFCKNFIFPKEKRKRGFVFIPIMKDIILRFI